MSYVIVITAADGTMSVSGFFGTQARAQAAAGPIEEAGLDTAVRPVEPYASVMADIGARR